MSPTGCLRTLSAAVRYSAPPSRGFCAYVTNRRWVFHSEAKGAKAIGKELAAFLGARLGTGLLDMLIMYLCVDLLGWNDMVMKLASNVIVVILNYILSKFFIFKKKEK